MTMKPPGWGLYLSLILIGGVIGYLLTEIALGSGLYGAVVFALIGALLAWMILRTRQDYTPEEIAAAVAERERREAAMNAGRQANQAAQRTKIAVVKSSGKKLDTKE